jgi:hypothetical protein
MTPEDKKAQGTAWLQGWVKPLIGSITVDQDPYHTFAWKIYRGDLPLWLDDLLPKATTSASPDEKVRHRALWTQLKNILDQHGVDTTPMGIAYPE